MIIQDQTFTLPILSRTCLYPTRKRFDTLSSSSIWKKDEDELLEKLIIENSLNVCNENNQNKKKQWQYISSFFPNKTPQQIMNRWNKVLNPILIKGNWSKEEDELLINWVKENGERGWSKIAAKLNGRIGKQCRERWINCLNPSIRKTEWTDDEDKKIIELHNKFGNKWSKIAAEIQGRSDNQIKNRWSSTLKRRIDCNLEDKNDSKNSDFDWNLSLFRPENNDNIYG